MRSWKWVRHEHCSDLLHLSINPERVLSLILSETPWIPSTILQMLYIYMTRDWTVLPFHDAFLQRVGENLTCMWFEVSLERRLDDFYKLIEKFSINNFPRNMHLLVVHLWIWFIWAHTLLYGTEKSIVVFVVCSLCTPHRLVIASDHLRLCSVHSNVYAYTQFTLSSSICSNVSTNEPSKNSYWCDQFMMNAILTSRESFEYFNKHSIENRCLLQMTG